MDTMYNLNSRIKVFQDVLEAEKFAKQKLVLFFKRPLGCLYFGVTFVFWQLHHTEGYHNNNNKIVQFHQNSIGCIIINLSTIWLLDFKTIQLFDNSSTQNFA